jgi:hypothetical protein
MVDLSLAHARFQNDWNILTNHVRQFSERFYSGQRHCMVYAVAIHFTDMQVGKTIAEFFE